MKVIIEITGEGYTKTLVMSDGKKHVQEWERDMYGFATTNNSGMLWESLNINEDLKETMDEINHELGNLSRAIRRVEIKEEPWI